jgi:hypothetical protein
VFMALRLQTPYHLRHRASGLRGGRRHSQTPVFPWENTRARRAARTREGRAGLRHRPDRLTSRTCLCRVSNIPCRAGLFAVKTAFSQKNKHLAMRRKHGTAVAMTRLRGTRVRPDEASEEDHRGTQGCNEIATKA